MALAAVPVAERAASALGKAVTADLVVIGGKWFREVRVKTPAKNKRGWKWSKELVPVDFELHVNPLAMALGALGVAVAGFFAVGRVKVGVPTIGEIELYKGPLADEFDTFKENWKTNRNLKKECEAAGGIWMPDGTCFIPSDKSCEELFDAVTAAKAAKDWTLAARISQRAKDQGCAWAGG